MTATAVSTDDGDKPHLAFIQSLHRTVERHLAIGLPSDAVLEQVHQVHVGPPVFHFYYGEVAGSLDQKILIHVYASDEGVERFTGSLIMNRTQWLLYQAILYSANERVPEQLPRVKFTYVGTGIERMPVARRG